MKRPASDSLQGGPGVLGQQERTREQQGDQAVPVVLAEILDRGHVLHARVGHHEVEAAEAFDRRVHCGAVARARGQVGLERHARAAGLEVHAQHLPAVGFEPRGDRPADAARRSGHDCAHRRKPTIPPMAEGKLLWEPSRERLEDSKLARFMRKHGHGSYDELWRWSVEDLEGFWGSIWERVRGGASERLRARARRQARCRAPSGFPARELNYAEHMLAHGPLGATAIVHASESQPLAELSWDELRDQVARCAAGLRRLGVGRGDRVAAYLPNGPEAVVALPGHGEHRRDLVELRAGVRRADGDRPLRADRAQGADRDRRLPLRRQGLRPRPSACARSRRRSRRSSTR